MYTLISRVIIVLIISTSSAYSSWQYHEDEDTNTGKTLGYAGVRNDEGYAIHIARNTFSDVYVIRLITPEEVAVKYRPDVMLIIDNNNAFKTSTVEEKGYLAIWLSNKNEYYEDDDIGVILNKRDIDSKELVRQIQGGNILTVSIPTETGHISTRFSLSGSGKAINEYRRHLGAIGENWPYP